MTGPPQPTPLGMELTLGERAYTVVKLGAPVCSKSANASYLRALGFTAADLTYVGATPLDCEAPELAYVVWCTQAEAQKLVTPELLKQLLAASDAPEGDAPDERVELPDGRVVVIPARPQQPAEASRKRKRVAVERAIDVLESGAFVLDDALLEDGCVHPAVRRVAFGGDQGEDDDASIVELDNAPVAAPAVATPALPTAADPASARLRAFAEMLLCMHVAPPIEQVHSWARVALTQ